MVCRKLHSTRRFLYGLSFLPLFIWRTSFYNLSYEKDKDRCLNQQHIEYIKKTILEKYNNYIINIGVSGIKKGLRSLQEGFNEAELALSSLMQQHNDNNDICYFEKLGILQLLVGSDYNKDFICQFIDSKIGKIIRYDQEKNTELLETLEELIYVDNLKK